eukprot:scaffold45752_cov56-Phaeocystis_antarctica.AAC.2
MQGHEVQLYAILLDGALNRYPKVEVIGESDMPSGGALSNPNDKALVTSLEDKMIEAYGTALVEVKCKAVDSDSDDDDDSDDDSDDDDVHEPVAKPAKPDSSSDEDSSEDDEPAGGKAVNLGYKMLRPMHVGALFAAVERYQVAELDLQFNQLRAAGGALVAAALNTNTTLTSLKCAQLGQPSKQVPRVGVLAGPWHRHATLAALALFTFLSPCAQP